MELRHLRYFLAVAEEGQFTRAAARLHIQQPPLSQQIQELEQELGFALFMRQPRGVTLTAPGETFAARARSVLLELDNAVVHARRVAQGQIGTVRVALTSSAAFHPLTPTAIRNFREMYPQIAIEMNEVNAAEIIEMMLNDRADAAILRKPVDTPTELRFELLAEERMLLVLPVGHRLIGNRAVPLKQLAKESFIFVRRPGAPGMYADFIRACEAKGFEPHVVEEVPRMVTAINLVAAGGGVSIVPASMHRYHQESVRYCRVAGDHAFRAPLHLVTRRELQSPAASHFRETLLEFVSQHPYRE
ncbi:LysR family transcriptional regulator [bacterium M00.F.Ca.ET.228.01.1.1]|uniref:LysR family transcriptional regulator n=1 Tax=Paraburkholderia phenoliruptrix TaxID=252970 RepID=UPI001091C12A|nr:LysR family transcriptional regulator [Paraburkholderia phenoliruptrix]TGP42139.1 LysR family transcriptional regulator [bacterium M00.F.Ca.ET.228.01.1.1]TGR99570.1 LysR family transcriptional regulator [bacterium M00.F.Ca.ET.191.01.1.1]TGU03937.1 LysR family transcriptional regulator [bacterium M00.F.Ca.ET.155.01.1.1]MBW0448304.1 LysR family transcriptional regulator [Paraburkholderia phenoliruptrix]MBW9099515.1 LysR family transcriptional regulator [Paraburkholderia phenoliruptrix]